MKRNMKQAAWRIIIGASLIAGGTGLAVAHHSYSAFDMAEPENRHRDDQEIRLDQSAYLDLDRRRE